MKTTIWMAFFAIAATCALAEVPPVLTTEPVAQKWGEEADDEVQRDGLLFWRDDCGALYIGDGETPGGKAVCVGLPPDLYSWTNDVSANGHALLWGGGWSQQAEGGSLLVRLGTNSWLRFVAADAGTLANLAVSDLDQANGTMRLTADTADPGAVLLVATNLLDPEAWQPATNGEIVASTDASTTWLITLLDTPFEVYRVRTSVTLEASIHAERTLHANQGISIPEGQQLAFGTNSIGGSSNGVKITTRANTSGLTLTNSANGVFPITWNGLTKNGWGDVANHIVDASNVRCSLPGHSGFDKLAYFHFTGASGSGIGTENYKLGITNGLIIPAAPTDVGHPSTNKYVYLATVKNGRSDVSRGYGWELLRTVEEDPVALAEVNAVADSVSAVSGRVSAIENDLDAHIAAAVVPVETRVEELEAELHDWPEWCTLWWSDDTMTSGYNYIPTNHPTRNLRVIVTLTNGDRSISLPPGFAPDRESRIEVLLNLLGEQRVVMRVGTTTVQTISVQSTTTRRYIYLWDPVVQAWTCSSHTQNTTSQSFVGGVAYTTPPNAPATVEEWIAAWEAHKNGTPTLSLSPPALSPSSGHLELLDSLDALAGQAADEPNDFEPAAEAVE